MHQHVFLKRFYVALRHYLLCLKQNVNSKGTVKNLTRDATVLVLLLSETAAPVVVTLTKRQRRRGHTFYPRISQMPRSVKYSSWSKDQLKMK